MDLPPQLVAQSKLEEAQSSIRAGGDGVREGVALILVAIAEYINCEDSGGINSSQALAVAMRRLTEDPYLTLGVNPQSDDSGIKKTYRKLALRYHPDKNKATSVLFQAVQGAHDLLLDPEKRAEYDIKRKHQQEALSRLQKHSREADIPTGARSTADATKRATASTPSSDATSTSPTSGGSRTNRAGTSASSAGGSTNNNKPPLRPKLRSTNRTDTTVTLEWHCAGLPTSTAYELQWRKGMHRGTSKWIASPTLVVGSSCLKKNLDPFTRYEFRVREASARGWTVHCYPVTVVTLPSGAGTGGDGAAAGNGGGRSASTSPRQENHTPSPKRGSPSRAPQCAGLGNGNANGNDSANFTNNGGGVKSGSSGNDTNGWFWRGIDRAAEKKLGGEKGAPPKDKPQRVRTAQERDTPSEGSWSCVVCKRENEPVSISCRVCYTPRSYQAANLDRISVDRGSPANSPGGHAGSSTSESTSGPNAPTTENTVSSSKRQDSPSTSSKNAGRKSKQGSDEAGIHFSAKMPPNPPTHRVHGMPFDGGSTASKKAVNSDDIRISASAAPTNSDTQAAPFGGKGDDANAQGGPKGTPFRTWKSPESDLDNGGGGCSRGSGGCGLSAEFDEGSYGKCWQELKDENGLVYYFNASTGESQWEPPLWVDEIDPSTGVIYYVNCYSGESQWEQPPDFVPIVRENPFDITPDQDFHLESVLSPKRSTGAKSSNGTTSAAKKATKASSTQHPKTASKEDGG